MTAAVDADACVTYIQRFICKALKCAFHSDNIMCSASCDHDIKNSTAVSFRTANKIIFSSEGNLVKYKILGNL